MILNLKRKLFANLAKNILNSKSVELLDENGKPNTEFKNFLESISKTDNNITNEELANQMLKKKLKNDYGFSDEDINKLMKDARQDRTVSLKRIHKDKETKRLNHITDFINKPENGKFAPAYQDNEMTPKEYKPAVIDWDREIPGKSYIRTEKDGDGNIIKYREREKGKTVTDRYLICDGQGMLDKHTNEGEDPDLAGDSEKSLKEQKKKGKNRTAYKYVSDENNIESNGHKHRMTATELEIAKTQAPVSKDSQVIGQQIPDKDKIGDTFNNTASQKRWNLLKQKGRKEWEKEQERLEQEKLLKSSNESWLKHKAVADKLRAKKYLKTAGWTTLGVGTIAAAGLGVKRYLDKKGNKDKQNYSENSILDRNKKLFM